MFCRLSRHTGFVIKGLYHVAINVSYLQQDYARAVPLFDEGLRAYSESLSPDDPTFLSAQANRQRAVDLLQSLADQ